MQQPPELSTRLTIGLMLFFILFLVGAVSLGNAILTWDPEGPFRDQQILVLSTLRKALPGSLTLSRSEDVFVITSPRQVDYFLSLLVESELVPRHHSHPEDELIVDLAGHKSTYLLGRDSYASDEYWLQYQAAADVFPPTIKLFHSPALTAWLVRNGIAPSASTP